MVKVPSPVHQALLSNDGRPRPLVDLWQVNALCGLAIDQQMDKIDEVIIVKIDRKTARQSLFMLNTCVGHVKQILGINRPFIWTPYQLYKYLEKTK